jgi:hypothetical protein
MPIIPARFLVRLTYPCRYVGDIPHDADDRLLDLPEVSRVDNFAAMDDAKNFADVRLAWNELGLALQVQVKGKEHAAKGAEARPRTSDGISLWIDTRDARTSHRASRFCHQFHLLAGGGGPDHDEPVFTQTKINRALHDAPLCAPASVPFRMTHVPRGFVLEAFLPVAVLHGYDPEQNPRLGFYYAVRDAELGEQVLTVGADFPYWEDPSLWSTLELVR